MNYISPEKLSEKEEYKVEVWYGPYSLTEPDFLQLDRYCYECRTCEERYDTKKEAIDCYDKHTLKMELDKLGT